MKPKKFSVERLQGLPPGSRRAIFFLICENDKFVDFSSVHKAWEEKKRPNEKRQFYFLFDKWINGHDTEDAHRYNKKQKKGRDYPDAITFERNGVNARIYGFTTHPDLENRAIEVRVLVCFVRKFKRETDERNLNRCQQLHDNPDVQAAVWMCYLKEECE